MLALDGGGVRGALTVAFLERIEALLSEQRGQEVRLGDYFDLIGGTSTGAVIAGALALGYRTSQVKDFYLRLAPFAFKRQSWSMPVLQPKFDARGLRHQIEEVVGDRVLQSPDLITGYCIITKRMDTGSPWIISNNPRAPYWEEARRRYRQQGLPSCQPGARTPPPRIFLIRSCCRSARTQPCCPMRGQAAQRAMAGTRDAGHAAAIGFGSRIPDRFQTYGFLSMVG